MSVTTLSSLSINFSVFNVSVPPTTGDDRSSPPVAHHDDEKPRFRESALVSAMMAAFQALGIGQTASSTATGSTTSQATSTSTGISGTASATETTGATSTTGTATNATPAPDTLDKAVNEFAHALYGLLRRQGRGEHADGQHDGEHTHGNEGHGRGGYNGLVQRLEKLAQSLGGANSASPGSTPTASDTATGATAPSNTASSTDPVPASPNPRLDRLLTAFTNVLNFLQPASTTTAATPTSGAPAGTPVTTASVADKLKLFLTTLAQSLNTGEKLSPVGSRVNYLV